MPVPHAPFTSHEQVTTGTRVSRVPLPRPRAKCTVVVYCKLRPGLLVRHYSARTSTGTCTGSSLCMHTRSSTTAGVPGEEVVMIERTCLGIYRDHQNTHLILYSTNVPCTRSCTSTCRRTCTCTAVRVTVIYMHTANGAGSVSGSICFLTLPVQVDFYR